jgi:hypothetical protein
MELTEQMELTVLTESMAQQVYKDQQALKEFKV